MARVSKDCPTCGPKTPCTITMAPDAGGTSVTYLVTCNACGHEHAPDATTKILDGKRWARETKDAHGSLLDETGKIRE